MLISGTRRELRKMMIGEKQVFVLENKTNGRKGLRIEEDIAVFEITK